MEQEASNGCSFDRNRKKKTKTTGKGNHGTPIWKTKRPARDWLRPWLATPAQGWSKRSIRQQSHPWEGLKQGRSCNSLLLSKRGWATGTLHPSVLRKERAQSILLPMETNLGSGARQHCSSGGSAYTQLRCLNEPENRWMFYQFSPWIFGGFFVSGEKEDAKSTAKARWCTQLVQTELQTRSGNSESRWRSWTTDTANHARCHPEAQSHPLPPAIPRCLPLGRMGQRGMGAGVPISRVYAIKSSARARDLSCKKPSWYKRASTPFSGRMQSWWLNVLLHTPADLPPLPTALPSGWQGIPRANKDPSIATDLGGIYCFTWSPRAKFSPSILN